MATFALIGLPGLTRDFAAYRKDVQVKLGHAVKATAHAMRDRAKVLAPRDQGDLIRAIEAQGKGARWRVGLRDGPVPGRGGSNSAHQNPWVYGVWYELGFITRNIQSHPYMAPARDAEASPHVDRIQDALNEAIP